MNAREELSKFMNAKEELRKLLDKDLTNDKDLNCNYNYRTNMIAKEELRKWLKKDSTNDKNLKDDYKYRTNIINQNRYYSDYSRKEISEFEKKCREYINKYSCKEKYIEDDEALFTYVKGDEQHIDIYVNAKGKTTISLYDFDGFGGLTISSEDIGYEYLKNPFDYSIEDLVALVMKLKIEKKLEIKRRNMVYDLWQYNTFQGILTNRVKSLDGKTTTYVNNNEVIFQVNKNIKMNGLVSISINSYDESDSRIKFSLTDIPINELDKYTNMIRAVVQV